MAVEQGGAGGGTTAVDSCLDVVLWGSGFGPFINATRVCERRRQRMDAVGPMRSVGTCVHAQCGHGPHTPSWLPL